MQIFSLILLLFNIVWTGFLYLDPSHHSAANYLYNLSYALNFILCAYLCLSYIPKHSLFRTSLRLFALSFGSFAIAQCIWAYSNLFLSAEIPYPGPADFFWIIFYPLMAIGFYLLVKGLELKFSFVSYLEIFILSSLIFLLLSSFLSLNITQVGLPFLTQILNYAYPAADAILIALGIVTIRSQTDRLNYHLLFFIFGFVALTAGDTLFTYQTNLNTYWNGNFVDALYAISGCLFLLGTIKLPNLFRSSTYAAGTLSLV